MQNLRSRKPTAVRPRAKQQRKSQFRQFQATELYCPKCGRSMPVRERLLLVLPEGDKYEYLCAACGTSVGDRIVRGEQQPLLVVPR
ncbi:MAG: cytoplasmic protein [Thermodesulfobacteriota bacterium]